MDDATTRRSALLIATLSAFLTPFMVSATNIALPTISRELHIDAVSLTWVSMGYSLAAATFLLPFGRLADIYGRKKIFTYGIACYTAASSLCALANSALMLIFFRVLQGIAGAMIFGTGMAILTSVFPAGESGKVLGLNTAAVYVGLSAGPFIGGLMTEQLGWRSIFLIAVPLGLAIVPLTIWQLKGEWAGSKGESFDLVGALIFGPMLVCTMYGVSQLPHMTGAGLVVLGLVGGGSFVMWESRINSPLLNVRLFKNNRILAFSNLAALINYSATSEVGLLLSLYLQYVKGFSPQNAGMILLAQPATQALFSPLAGRLSDKIEPRIVASAGMSMTMLGLILCASLSPQAPLWFIVASLLFLGFGFALFSSPNSNAIMGSVERRYYGVTSATLGTMRLMGNMFSTGISLLMLSFYVGRVQITTQNITQFMASAKTTFTIFVVLCCGGIFASLARGKTRK